MRLNPRSVWSILSYAYETGTFAAEKWIVSATVFCGEPAEAGSAPINRGSGGGDTHNETPKGRRRRPPPTAKPAKRREPAWQEPGAA